MRFGSVCSGVEAASVAWEPLGWKAAWFAEIEKFPSAVLAHRFPEVPNLGDMTKLHETKVFQDEPIDLLVGGTPCQSFSVAGLRKGMADPRGNLALTYLSLADRKRPRWIVWENVPGVLSSSGGRDFGAFLGGLGQLGYGFAYRVLDAQYFGVAQRRRRVFVVGYLGDWRPASAVLFEPHCMQGHSAPSREAGERVAGYTAGSFGGYREGCGTIRAQGGDYGGGTETLIAEAFAIQERAVSENINNGPQGKGYQKHIAYTLEARHNVQSVAHTLRAEHDASEDGTGRGVPLVPSAWPAQVASTLNAAFGSKLGLEDQHINSGAPLFVPASVAVALRGRDGGATAELGDDCAFTLRASSGGGDKPHILSAMAVRRLTPRECERLQGFPDDHTLVPFRGKPAADGPRYKAMGNSMAVPVMRWIGTRIKEVESAWPKPAANDNAEATVAAA